MVYYLTSEKTTSNNRFLAFKARSFVISWSVLECLLLFKNFYVEKSQRSQEFLSGGLS